MILREAKRQDGTHYAWQFWCPACDDRHILSGWTFNGDMTKPTFTPSVLVTYNGADAGGNGPPARCHSYVTDGQIAFQGDCSHEMAGETVDLPDWPSYVHQ